MSRVEQYRCLLSEKILFVGDIHIKFNNMEDVNKLEKCLLSTIENDDILFIVIAGDILDTHERVHTQLMIRAYELFRSLMRCVRLYVIVGNHDYINNQQFLTSVHWMNGMSEWKDVTIIDKPTWVYDYLLMPYVPTGRFVEALSTSKRNWQEAKCIFAHQEIYNCKMGAIQSTSGDKWECEWPLLISGHVHDRQQLQTNVLYPGSALNHSFGTDNQGISKFTFMGQKPDLTYIEDRIDIGLEKKIIVYKSIQELLAEGTRDGSYSKNTKLSLEGSIVDIASFKKSAEYSTLINKNVKVVFRHQPRTHLSKYPLHKEHINFSKVLTDLVQEEHDSGLVNDLEMINNSFKLKK